MIFPAIKNGMTNVSVKIRHSSIHAVTVSFIFNISGAIKHLHRSSSFTLERFNLWKVSLTYWSILTTVLNQLLSFLHLVTILPFSVKLAPSGENLLKKFVKKIPPDLQKIALAIYMVKYQDTHCCAKDVEIGLHTETFISETHSSRVNCQQVLGLMVKVTFGENKKGEREKKSKTLPRGQQQKAVMGSHMSNRSSNSLWSLVPADFKKDNILQLLLWIKWWWPQEAIFHYCSISL